MPREELRSRLKLVTEAFEDILASAPIQDDGTTIRHAGHVPTPTPTQQRDIRSLVEQAQRAPYMPPTPDLEGELLAFMFEQRLLIRIAPEIAFAPNAYDAMVGWVRTQIDTHGSVTVAQVRDQFGTTRKYALALLEHLDERKITRRVEDVRVLY
jgi:selenocysteine-specific elongation factor